MGTGLDPEALLQRIAAAAASVDADAVRALKTSWLYCVIGQVRDDTPEQLQSNVERAVQIYASHHGVINDLIASVHVVVFGMFANTNEKSQQSAAKELLEALGADIRIVTFNGNIVYGNIGTDTRMNYTLLLPHFDRFLAELLNTNFGQITELGSIG